MQSASTKQKIKNEDENELNKYQMLYLDDCCQNGEKVDEKYLEELGNLTSGIDPWIDEYIDADDVYEHWDVYRKLIKYIDIPDFFPEYPCLTLEKVNEFYEAYNLLFEYLVHNDENEKKYTDYSLTLDRFRYEDDKYEMYIPMTLKALILECRINEMYIFDDILSFIRQEKIIAFLQKKDRAIVEPSVLIEIYLFPEDLIVNTLRHVFDEDEQRFIDKYIEEKKMDYAIGADENGIAEKDLHFL